MMKKNALALGVAALIGSMGLMGTASADVIVTGDSNAQDLRVNAGGIGHSLLIPYFTVQNGNVTLINLVNTDTVNGKAIKIRFRGASNSDDLLDFQILMSPGDVWTANLSAGADGRMTLFTNDNTCTLPSIKGVPVPAVLDRLPPGLSADARAAQTREGYVEIFNMADIRPAAGATTLFTAIKHVNGVAPCTTSVLNTLQANPTNEAEAAGLGLYAPTTGLFSNFFLVNQVTASTSWSAEATSLLAVTAAGGTTAGFGNIVFFPQTGANLPNPTFNTADPLIRQGLLTGLMFDAPDMSTPYLNNIAVNTAQGPIDQAIQLSMAIATTSIRNEFLTVEGISAKSDWTFSMPTRRYAVAYNYAGTAANNPVFNPEASPYFTTANSSVFNNNGMPQICVTTGAAGAASETIAYDQEERPQQSGFVFSPGTATRVRFCGEVSVLSFNLGNSGTSGTLRAELARQDIVLPYNAGWFTIATPGLVEAGLPILGRYYLVATNPANAGFSTNFGASFDHRYARPVPAIVP